MSKADLAGVTTLLAIAVIWPTIEPAPLCFKTSVFDLELATRGETISMQTALIYVGAALTEIAGCFAFWAWLRLGKPLWWLFPGILSLIVFAYLLTLVETHAAGRAYAAYGGIYIVASLVWLWGIEAVRPDRWDITGSVICLGGAAVILWGPRG